MQNCMLLNSEHLPIIATARASEEDNKGGVGVAFRAKEYRIRWTTRLIIAATFFTVMVLYVTNTISKFKPPGPMGSAFIGILLFIASVYLLIALISISVSYELIHALRQTRVFARAHANEGSP